MNDERAGGGPAPESRPSSHEERVLELALAALAGEAPPAGLAPAERAELRGHLEVFGLLPYALEPVAPPPGLERRLLARLAAERASAPAAPREQRAARPARRWLLPLAAALVVALGGLDLALWRRVEGQGARIADLNRQLAEARRAEVDSGTARAELAALRSYLSVVTSPAVLVCPLRPVEPAAASPEARGVLFVKNDHQHWYLALEGLPASPAERTYQLWFIAEGRPVGAGTFESIPGRPLELYATTMPAGTTAVAVTIEPTGGVPTPTGPQVLFGGDVTQIL